MEDFSLEAVAPKETDVALSSLLCRVDTAAVFLTYVTCNGNRFKTAAATNLSVEQVDDLARHGDWSDKLKQRAEMAGLESKTGEAINNEILRLKASSQAQRIMEEIDAVLLHLFQLPKEEKLKYLFETKKDGTKTPTASMYVELSKAAAQCHQSLYRASGDQLPGRPEAQSAETAGKAMALGIAAEIGKLAGLVPKKA